MKKLLPLICVLFLFGKATAQQVEFDSLILPIATPSPEFREYLVQLAWINNPANKVYDHNVNIAKQDVRITKLDWANDVGLTFNLNENNIKSTDNSIPNATEMALEDAGGLTQEQLNALDASRGLVDLGNLNQFPRYNLAVTLNLGRIINLNKEIQKSKEKLHIEEANLDQQKLEIRSEVYRRYEAYLQNIDLYNMRQQSEVDYRQIYNLIEARFKGGSSDFEEYSRASASYQSARESTLSAKTDIALAKIDLEEIIGIPLEYATGFHKQTRN